MLQVSEKRYTELIYMENAYKCIRDAFSSNMSIVRLYVDIATIIQTAEKLMENNREVE